MKTSYTGKLILFTSFYEHRAYSPYIEAMTRTVACLEKLGIQWEYWPSHGDFHLERAINGTLTRFINDEEATDFLMIDADTSWHPEGVCRLLYHEQDIVAGSYRMKHLWEQYVGVIKREDGVPLGRMLPDGTAIVEATRIPGGFVRFKKSALRVFRDAYPELRSKEINIDGSFVEHVVFFERYRKDDVSHCHDYGFSRRWLEIGGQLFIDPYVKVDHWGITRYAGNLEAHLRGKAAVETVQQMAEAIKNLRSAA